MHSYELLSSRIGLSALKNIFPEPKIIFVGLLEAEISNYESAGPDRGKIQYPPGALMDF